MYLCFIFLYIDACRLCFVFIMYETALWPSVIFSFVFLIGCLKMIYVNNGLRSTNIVNIFTFLNIKQIPEQNFSLVRLREIFRFFISVTYMFQREIVKSEFVG